MANAGSGRIRLDLDEVAFERLAAAATGLTRHEAENAFARAMVDGSLGEDDVRLVLEEKRQIVRQSGLLEFLPSGGTLADVGGLENLKRWLGRRSGVGRSVMTFTGYRVERLRDAATAGRDDVANLLGATDLLVDGPYLRDRHDPDRPWVGSTNQRFHLLTDRYRGLAPPVDRQPDRIEIRVLADGQVAVNGWASAGDLDDLLSGL